MCRCCNVYHPEEVLTLYTDYLCLKMGSVVAQYQTSRCNAIYMVVVNFAQYGEDAVRALNLTPQSNSFGKAVAKAATFCTNSVFGRQRNSFDVLILFRKSTDRIP